MVNDVNFEQISGSLGSLLLLWAAIEREARKEVARLNDGILPRSAFGISSVLSAWEAAVVQQHLEQAFRALLASTLRSQLQEPLNIRNGLCHGLLGASAEHHGKPAALMWEINEERRHITWDELQASFGWLSKVPDALSMICNSSAERPGNRMTDNPENRKWWLTEYGISL
jgi:hypothetical protein